MIECNKQRGKSLGLECTKYQALGEVTAYKNIVRILEGSEDHDNANVNASSDNHLSSDQLFEMIYESYDFMFKYAASKEMLFKLATLKYAKRMCGIWINYMIGVLTKIK